MNLRLLLSGFALGVLSTFLIGAGLIASTRATDDSMTVVNQPGPEDFAKLMDKWIQSMKPGPNHKTLNDSIGTWDTTTRMWMGGPDAPPAETHGTATRRWILGNRFVQEELVGEMMLPDPATNQMKAVPYHGMGLTGYDNLRNLYVGCWVDTTNTQIITIKGSASPDGKRFTFYGELDEPLLEVYGRYVKYVIEKIDEDTTTFSIYDLHAGDDFKPVEITYKRRTP